MAKKFPIIPIALGLTGALAVFLTSRKVTSASDAMRPGPKPVPLPSPVNSAPPILNPPILGPQPQNLPDRGVVVPLPGQPGSVLVPPGGSRGVNGPIVPGRVSNVPGSVSRYQGKEFFPYYLPEPIPAPDPNPSSRFPS